VNLLPESVRLAVGKTVRTVNAGRSQVISSAAGPLTMAVAAQGPDRRQAGAASKRATVVQPGGVEVIVAFRDNARRVHYIYFYIQA